MSWFNALFNATVQTDLTGYTGDPGVAWTLVKGSVSPIVYPGANGIAATGGNSVVLARANLVSPANSCKLTASMHFDSATGYHGFAFTNAAGTAGYLLAISASKAIAIWRVTSAADPTSVAELAASPVQTLAQGDVFDLELDIDNTVPGVTVLTVKFNGSVIINAFQDTNAARYAAVGYPCLFFGTSIAAGTGTWVNGLTGDPLSAGAPATAPDAPTIGAVVAGAGYVDVAFTNNATGGSAILDNTAYLSTGEYASGTASPIRVPVAGGVALTATVKARNTVGLSPASGTSSQVTPTAPVVAAVTYPVTTQYADLVRDTSTSVSAATITVANSAPNGHRTFASAYAVGTKGIPIFYGDTGHGSNWMIALATLTSSNTLTVDRVLTSSAGGTTAPTFGVGTKDVFVTLPSRMAPRKHYIDLADYPVDPSFTADSMTGFQQAIFDALAWGISVIFIPDGHYKWAGPLGVSNAQVYVPNTRQIDHNRSIRFVGASQPNMETQGLVSMSPPVNGVVIESTLRVTSGTGYMLAGEAGSNGDSMKWNYTNVGFSNICFRTKVDAGMNNMGALDLSMFSQVTEFDKIRVDVNMPIIASPNPVSGGSIGVKWPPVDNHAQFHIGTALITGHAHGMEIGEHFDAHRLTFLGCGNALKMLGGNHGSSITHLLVECCKTSMRVEGNHPLSIQCYSTEHNSDGNWFDFVSDLNHVAGNRKVVIVQSTVITSHVGIDDSGFTTNATAANLKILVGSGAN